jgi:hypothetical protein
MIVYVIHDIDTDWSVDVEEEAMHNRCTQPTYKKIINKKSNGSLGFK